MASCRLPVDVRRYTQLGTCSHPCSICAQIIASVPYDWPRGRLFFCTLGRLLFVPLLMLCAAPRSAPVFRDASWPLVFSLLLGITNGYFGSVPMILAPSRVPDAHKELTGDVTQRNSWQRQHGRSSNTTSTLMESLRCEYVIESIILL